MDLWPNNTAVACRDERWRAEGRQSGSIGDVWGAMTSSTVLAVGRFSPPSTSNLLPHSRNAFPNTKHGAWPRRVSLLCRGPVHGAIITMPAHPELRRPGSTLGICRLTAIRRAHMAGYPRDSCPGTLFSPAFHPCSTHYPTLPHTPHVSSPCGRGLWARGLTR